MITERTLKKWRKEALEIDKFMNNLDHIQVKINPLELSLKEFAERILRMSQELMDLHLVRK